MYPKSWMWLHGTFNWLQEGGIFTKNLKKFLTLTDKITNVRQTWVSLICCFALCP